MFKRNEKFGGRKPWRYNCLRFGCSPPSQNNFADFRLVRAFVERSTLLRGLLDVFVACL